MADLTDNSAAVITLWDNSDNVVDLTLYDNLIALTAPVSTYLTVSELSTLRFFDNADNVVDLTLVNYIGSEGGIAVVTVGTRCYSWVSV